jgi:uncharacterized SAM-binding protein YcdF (DUF218 family)
MTEAEANSAYWRMLGVPHNRIIAEARSQDTTENAHFLLEALDDVAKQSGNYATAILLVTTPFHLARYRLNVEIDLLEQRQGIEVYALGSVGSRYYGAEFYFYTDPKAGYNRSMTLKVVFNEYLKIAFDLCAERRTAEAKAAAILA